jgi:putative DNA primase/helicase
MREILPNKDVRHFIQKAVGYSLTGLVIERVFLFLYGTGKNGKSTLVSVLDRLFGRYAVVAGSKLFYSVEYHPTPDDQVAELFGKRIAFASESRERARLNEDFIKQVTRRDKMRGCWKYKHGFWFQPQVVPWISGNHKPVIKGTDEGIWDRVRLVPFEQTFVAGQNRVANLDSILFKELPGILNWAIEGALLWQREGVPIPWKIRHAVAEYRTEEDMLGDFISEHIVIGGVGVPHSNVFDAYFKWTLKERIRYSVSSKTLAKMLRERGWKDKPVRGHKVFWRGVSLTTVP